MIKNREIFESLNPRKTNISTATAGSGTTVGVYGNPKPLMFAGRNRIVCSKAVWCERLNDNLLSVGRLCDAGFSVVFTARNCLVFVGDRFRGKPLHQQARDPATGLYPIFLVQNLDGDCRPMRRMGPLVVVSNFPMYQFPKNLM